MIVSYPYGDMLRRQMQSNVTGFTDRRADPDGLKHAAVALTVVDSEQGASFILTRRASKLRAHSGQFALPGGRVEPGETSIQAALREMHEEVGVELGEEHVLGLLDDYPTRSGYRITPVVVWAGSEVAVKADPGEVAKVHIVPLAQLARDDTPEFASIPESDRPLIRLNIAGAKVHAPTAAVIYQFREVAIFGRNARVEHLEQPVWAWR
jgi:mutator protein MutT